MQLYGSFVNVTVLQRAYGLQQISQKKVIITNRSQISKSSWL